MQPRLNPLKLAGDSYRAMAALDKTVTSTGLDHVLMHMVKCAPHRLTAAHSVSTCTGKMPAPSARPSNASMVSMRGKNRRTTPTANAPPSLDGGRHARRRHARSGRGVRRGPQAVFGKGNR